MLVEFVGGALNGKQMIVSEPHDQIYNEAETYNATVTHYRKLGFVYLWYEIFYPTELKDVQI